MVVCVVVVVVVVAAAAASIIIIISAICIISYRSRTINLKYYENILQAHITA